MMPGVPPPDGADELLANTREGLAHLRSSVEALDKEALAVVPAAGWGVTATLAHLAFYDDWVAERWRRYLYAGAFQTLPDGITDLVNAAGLRGWQAVAPDQARQIACRAAEEVTKLILEVPRRALEAAIDTGRLAMVDRSLHWGPHLDEMAILVKGGGW